ncbi:MAG: diphosphomevalonate decarboxylase [Kiritimatiellae bacterium]|nr:diphosphomevalonate decarboxylase [Kiritimatiellia bacterium]
MRITREDVVSQLLAGASDRPVESADVYAPANIALCKYWGKRCSELNLPVTGSLSLSLGSYGSHLRMSRMTEATTDRVTHNGVALSADTAFVRTLTAYLDLFRAGAYFNIETRNTIPTAAGFASSASGFAAAVRGLDTLMGWALSPQALSSLARLGSGSACRSVYDGLVEWDVGSSEDGMDSFATPLRDQWPDLRIGLLVLTDKTKPIGSRQAMQHTVDTSPLYRAWPETVASDLATIKAAITERSFERLGQAVEGNAMAMHSTMFAARPSVIYWTPETVATITRVRQLRDEGLMVYCTMDAGPNVKLLFLHASQEAIEAAFPDVVVTNAYNGDV